MSTYKVTRVTQVGNHVEEEIGADGVEINTNGDLAFFRKNPVGGGGYMYRCIGSGFWTDCTKVESTLL